MRESTNTEWVMVRIGDILHRRNERAQGHEPLLSVTKERGVIRQEEVGRRDSSSADKGGYWRVHPADIVYNTMRMWQGVSGCSPHFGIVSPAYTVCQPSQVVHSRYVAHLLRHPSLINAFYKSSQGLVSDTWNLKYPAFSQICVKLPSKREQRRIADILDTIDERIRAAEVARGKASKVRNGIIDEHLGRTLGARRVTLGEVMDSAVDGPFGSNIKGEHYVDRPGVRIVRLQNVGIGRFIDEDHVYIDERYARALRKHEVCGGDLLVASLGDEAHPIARACLYPEHLDSGIVKADCFRLRLDQTRIIHRYAVLVLNSPITRRGILRYAQGVTRDRVNLTSLHKFDFPLPLVEDQRAICEATSEQTVDLEQRDKEIAKSKLLKRGLADDLLRGRVRVGEYERAL